MGKELFGTDGIRGIPGTEPLDDATLYATGRALGLYLRREHAAPRALIGMDTRESGPHLAAMIAKDERYESSILPIRDGVMVALRVAD